MAGRFYPHKHQQDLGQDKANVHLKPMLLSANSIPSTTDDSLYTTLPRDIHTSLLQLTDARLKARIRLLKILSRITAVLLSLATLIPLILTLQKFLQTRNTYFDVNGVQRTAWAKGTVTWYTYTYTAVSGISLILNLIVVVSYIRGVRQANKAATVSSWWTWGIMILHVVTWAVSAGIYRYGKEPNEQGRFVDLWGWTCSRAARELQLALTSVDFDKYCAIQTTSFYTGIANAAAGVLGIAIMILAHMRTKTKKSVKRATTFRVGDDDLEPLRPYPPAQVT